MLLLSLIDALNILPVVVEIIWIAIPIKSNIIVILHAHFFLLISHKRIQGIYSNYQQYAAYCSWNAIKGSALRSNKIPPIIVSIAIIVTPRGLVDFSFYNLFSIIRILFNCKYNMIRSRSYITNLIKLINSACMPCMFL